MVQMRRSSRSGASRMVQYRDLHESDHGHSDEHNITTLEGELKSKAEMPFLNGSYSLHTPPYWGAGGAFEQHYREIALQADHWGLT